MNVKEYNLLSEREKEKYKPVYNKFRKKRFTDYCGECGYEHYYYQNVPVGKPFEYMLKTEEELVSEGVSKVWEQKAIEMMKKNLVIGKFFKENV